MTDVPITNHTNALGKRNMAELRGGVGGFLTQRTLAGQVEEQEFTKDPEQEPRKGVPGSH